MTKLLSQFALKNQLELAFRYNIAPTQQVAAVCVPGDNHERQLVLFHWGLVPSWADDPSIGNRMINARAESVAEKPSFRSAFKKRRCLILADGYYEWKKAGTKKQPYHIHMGDDRPFALAGLWEQWRGGGESEPPLESCTIITTGANEFTSQIHDRMPVILEPADYDAWLDPEVSDRAQLQALLVPYEPAELVAQPVNIYVNNSRNEGPECLTPVDKPLD